jgi:uncharacterized protein (TIGR00255 family)
MIRGMTGFGRAQGQAAWGAWTWEVRSVNGKSVDLRTNLPAGCEAVDFEARRRVKDRFNRGSFQLQLRIELAREAGAMAIDTRELARLARLSRNWANGRVRPATFDGLLGAMGASKNASRTGLTVDESMQKELLAGLEQALDSLAEARAREGEALADVCRKMLGEIEDMVGQAGKLAAGQSELVRERLRTRLAELGKDVAVDPDRIAQEVMLMANRADVREELDRLGAHVATARGHLKSGDQAGRKLDFLCQELNRETNTLCSKSASLELTNAGLALKSLIDQFREQVQNVE